MLLTHAPLSLALRLLWEDAGKYARINGLPRNGCKSKDDQQRAAWFSGWVQEDMRIARLAESASVVETDREA